MFDRVLNVPVAGINSGFLKLSTKSSDRRLLKLVYYDLIVLNMNQ